MTRVRGLAVRLAAIAVCAAARLDAQGAPAGAAGETEQIVVMIRGTLDGQETIGAGILVGSANDRL
ncbi:MAG TPA: hypothetical protein VFS59_17710, partial [Gemmatimonadaceae bacterium]|nr:hypothetical protein [Gemmatimonadaceae bacterium]